MIARAEREVHPLNVFLGCVKFTVFFFIITIFLGHHGTVALLPLGEDRKQKYFLRSIKAYAVILQKILNVRVKGQAMETSGALIVSNHLSYLDVVILFSAYPSLFITSVEIRDTFLLGDICKLAGCFFVERRKRLLTPSLRDAEVAAMKRKLELGFNVFLFPEGTSSDGSGVLPFKAHFFQLAEAGMPVRPVCLRYSGEGHKVVPWYGDMTFADHLFRVCSLRSIEVELFELPELRGSNKFDLSFAAHKTISECYGKR